MSHNRSSTDSYYPAEIDLIELLKCFWEAKTLILISITITGLITASYISMLKPTYTASVELKLPPESHASSIKPVVSTAQLSTFLYPPSNLLKEENTLEKNNDTNQAPTFDSSEGITTKTALSLFLSTLESSAHINHMLTENPELLKKTLNIDSGNKGAINIIKSVRTIKYKGVHAKSKSLKPDSYFLAISGHDRSSLQTLILEDIDLASKSTTQQIRDYYTNHINQQLQHAQAQQKAELRSIHKHIEARKWYLTATLKNQIAELKEKLNISIATGNSGEKNKLLATLTTLEERNDHVFYDDALLLMQAQKKIISDNTLIPLLKTEIKHLKEHNETVSFSNNIVIIPTIPVSPKKKVILALGLTIGLIIGLVLATIKYFISLIKERTT